MNQINIERKFKVESCKIREMKRGEAPFFLSPHTRDIKVPAPPLY
jgi:hypothetical protein